MIYAVSACLMGDNCKYSGGNNLNDKAVSLCEDSSFVKICPELLGGLKIPRSPAEIRGNGGSSVLDGNAKVIDKNGNDITEKFLDGADAALKIVMEFANEGEEITALLKSRSPSCGCGIIYDGSFTGKTVSGDGVTAALFRRKGIKLLTEEDL